MNEATLEADNDATDWPPELEHGSDAPPPPPADDFDLSRLWRRVRRERAAIARLKNYLARATAQVRDAIARREAHIAGIEQLTISYLGHVGARKAVFPDLGTVHLATRQHVNVDPEPATAWASAEASHLMVAEPRLDVAALKKHVLSTGEVIPGVVIEEITSVAFRPR